MSALPFEFCDFLIVLLLFTEPDIPYTSKVILELLLLRLGSYPG